MFILAGLAFAADCRSLCAERVGITDWWPNGNILVQGPVPTTAFCREHPDCTIDLDGLNKAIGGALKRQAALPDGASSGLSEAAYARLSAHSGQAFDLSKYQLASHVNLASGDPDEIGALRAEWRFFDASESEVAAQAAHCNYTDAAGRAAEGRWPGRSVWNPCTPEPGFAHPTFASPPGEPTVHSALLGTSHWYPYNGCPAGDCEAAALRLPSGAPAGADEKGGLWTFPAGANFTACVQDVVELMADRTHGPRVVYMHCGGGTDRTGSLVLGYRMSMLGQSLADAYHSLLKTTVAGIARQGEFCSNRAFKAARRAEGGAPCKGIAAPIY